MTKMFTTCPSCRMNLAVTPGDLRVGQGYVRCGRCERVFNALLSLSEDLEPAQQSGHVATGTTSMPALEEQAPSATPPPPPPPAPPPRTPPLTLVEDDGNWAKITPLRQPTVPVPDMLVVEAQPSGTFETIVLEGDSFLQTEEHVDEHDVEVQLRELARQMDTAPLDDEDELEIVHPDEEVVLETTDGELDFDADLAVGNAPRHHWLWSVAAALLALMLVTQVVHASRQTLVAHPWFERPLQSIYAWFGVTLEPKWDLRAYDLRQLGGEAAPGTSGNIVLRATVHNRATSSQPPPMIRAVLQDRFGNALSTTAISPQEYLHGDAPSRMVPDQRLDAELVLHDPTRQAVGFELDACLPGAGARLHCSTDP